MLRSSFFFLSTSNSKRTECFILTKMYRDLFDQTKSLYQIRKKVKSKVDIFLKPGKTISSTCIWHFNRTIEWTFFWDNSGTIHGWHTVNTRMIPWIWIHLCWIPFGNQICSLPMRKVPIFMMSPLTTSCCGFPKMAKCSTVSGKPLLLRVLWFLWA